MVPVQKLKQLSFFQGIPATMLRKLATAASERTIEPGEMILHQHDEAQHLFLLIDGVAQFLIHFQGVDDLLVGTTGERGALLGWSAFRPPYRYTSSVRCEGRCNVIRLPRAAVEEILRSEPRIGLLLLRRVASELARRLEQTRDLLIRRASPGINPSAGV
jgi:CRP-like cAMP-binding protein